MIGVSAVYFNNDVNYKDYYQNYAEKNSIIVLRVDKVLKSADDFLKLEKEDDKVLIYNDNKKFTDKDARFYGAITFLSEDTIKEKAYAYPFDKNNFTFPISGETIIILSINSISKQYRNNHL